MISFLKNLFRRSLENPSTKINDVFGPPTLSGVTVNETTALGFIPIYAAINRISTDVASLSLKVYRNNGNGKVAAPENPIFDLIHFSPDGVLPSFRWRQALMGHVLSYGNGYSKIIRNGAGQPIRLQLLPPNQVRPEVVNNQLIYKWQGKEGLQHIPYMNMVHVAGLGFDGLQGYSPIRMCMSGVQGGMAAETFGNAFFGNAAKPSGILTSTKELKEQARKNLKASWHEAQGGPFNAGGTALLEDGITWQPISIPPDEGQWIQTMNFSVTSIARLYNLPPHKIGDYSRATFSNIEESNQDYIETSLRPWCDSIEGELNIKLFTQEERKQFFCQHNFMSFLRANSQSRSQYYAMARQWGWMNVDEIRAEEGQNALPNDEGQVYLSPLNMVPTDQLGKNTVPLASTKPKPIPPEANKRPYEDDEEDEEDNRQAVRAVVMNEIQRLIRRESASIRRAVTKPNFRAFLSDFYEEHETTIKDQMASATRAFDVVTRSKTNLEQLAKDWCSESRTILEQIEEVTIGDQRPQAIETVLTDWENTRADKLFGGTTK